MSPRPKVLIISDYYLPGFESGGAVRTIANMVDRLGDRFDFRIITRDHDGSAVKSSYKTVSIGNWNQVGNANVYYLRKDQIRFREIAKLLKEVNPDLVYLNSFFARLTIIYLILRRLGRFDKSSAVLAPEGEFSPGALSLSPLKKKLYISFFKLFRLSSGLIWKAASESERFDIASILGNGIQICTAPNMPPRTIFAAFDNVVREPKEPGKARMLFLSRFMRKKNFNWLLRQLRDIEGELSFDIWGTLEEPEYWDECQRLTAELPPNIRVQARGPVPHEEVSITLANYDFFVLPTLGENFGHVFIEAFASGLPVLTSDRTPWRGLTEKGIGWDIPLGNPGEWTDAVQHCIDMDELEYQTASSNARAFAVNWLSDPEIESSNLEMLTAALTRDKPRL